MNTSPDLDRVRVGSLDRIERIERNYKIAFGGAAAVEALLLGGFLLLADFSDRLHLLLLIGTVAVYTIVGLGLLALGAHVSRNTQIVLRAIEAARERGGRDGERRA
jgi:hypothetical protein